MPDRNIFHTAELVLLARRQSLTTADKASEAARVQTDRGLYVSPSIQQTSPTRPEPATLISSPQIQITRKHQIMASELHQIIRSLKNNSNASYPEINAQLSKAKIQLLKLKALVPSPNTPRDVLVAAREVFEIGALASIRATDPAAFTRYVHQLTPFYELPSDRLSPDGSERKKITGLYLLLLLTQGDYSGFHTELEGLEMLANGDGELEEDRYLGYAIKLERWLMEGSYDRVWKAMASKEVPSEEYSVFSGILTGQIRREIAACSEKAYPSLPISSTKNLLFLDSEGAVVDFAESRGWIVRDGRIYFPADGGVAGADGEEDGRAMGTIENTLGYARELETIV